MPQVKTRTERFDEAFKMLLIIATITFSGALAFYKEIIELRFFSYSIGVFVIAIIIWLFSTLYGEKYEYLLKTGAWWLLMFAFGTVFARLYFTVFLLPPLVVSLVVLLSLVLTLPMLTYLKETIGAKECKYLRIILLMPTLFFIFLDILYFLDLITLPLN